MAAPNPPPSLSSWQLERLAQALHHQSAADGTLLESDRIAQICEMVRQMESAAELHAFATKFNWNDDLSPLYQLLRHPQCDDGTALMIYWDTRLFERTSDDLSDWERRIYDLAIAIEQQLISGGFPQKTIAFDPKADRYLEWDHFFRNAQRELPSIIFEATSGAPLVLDWDRLWDGR
jgi:hypothetical protein